MNWLVQFVDIFFWALNLAILIRVIASWLNISPYNPIISFVWQITDPILQPLRRIVPPLGMLDIAPLIALMLLSVIQRILLSALYTLAR